MPKRRSQIAMTEEEQAAFLREGHTLEVASIGPRGYPHQVAMWYALLDGVIHFTTYTRSQKVQNRAATPSSVMLTGTQYGELRGLVIEGAEIIENDLEPAARVAMMRARAARRAAGGAALRADAADGPSAWSSASTPSTLLVDHRKLGGTYSPGRPDCRPSLSHRAMIAP
jgi:nitroimidazol reductase NimA-like FMN-containing flavoprotein (pyridoxamine 5'-phosphate oxidase superfamily)